MSIGWQWQMLRRLDGIGCTGFQCGPGVVWYALHSDRKVGGPFYSTEEFDAWLDEQEAEQKERSS